MVNVEVSLELPEGVSELGFKLQVMALLPEVQERATALLNPSKPVMLTVEVAELPGSIVRGEAFEAEIWKSGVVAESTVSVVAPR
jgi:hypothetical protein